MVLYELVIYTCLSAHSYNTHPHLCSPVVFTLGSAFHSNVMNLQRSFLPPQLNQPFFNDPWIIWRNVIVFKTSENCSVMSTGEIFFLQLLLGGHFESAQVHVGSSTPQEATNL